MRYVVVICIIAGFLIWDALSNRGHYLDQGVRVLRHAASYIGLG